MTSTSNAARPRANSSRVSARRAATRRCAGRGRSAGGRTPHHKSAAAPVLGYAAVRARSSRAGDARRRVGRIASAEMGGSGEDDPGDVPDRRDGLRPAGDVRLLLESRRARDLRRAVHVRLPGATAPDRPEHRGCDARDLGGRPHVDDPRPARHLLRRRSGVQGQEARARRRRLRLFVQAAARPADARALPVVSRRQDRRRRRGPREGEEGRAARLRCADRRPEGARPLHAADHARRSPTTCCWATSRNRRWRPSRAR